MYQKADRERILADLEASGLTVAVFARQPGNPSINVLYRWRHQAEEGLLDVPRRQVRGRCERNGHKSYPDATKREAVSLRRKGMGWTDIARKLHVASGSVVASWWKAAERAKMAPEEVQRMAKEKDTLPALREELDTVRAQAREAEMENAVLRELMRDPKAGDPESLSNRQKAGLGEKLRRDFGYSLKDIIGFLKVPKSTYEYNRAASRRDAGRAKAALERARHAFEASGRVYGYRRVHASIVLGADGIPPMAASEMEVRDAMKAGRMFARRTARKLAYSSYAGESDSRPANAPLCGDGTHAFHAEAPDELVATDVTEFKVGGGKVYLSAIVDCFDGMLAAWSVSLHPDSKLCNSSLLAYVGALPKGHPPVTEHSDGGCQYRAGSWKRICEENGVVRSMSRKGCCPDTRGPRASSERSRRSSTMAWTGRTRPARTSSPSSTITTDGIAKAGSSLLQKAMARGCTIRSRAAGGGSDTSPEWSKLATAPPAVKTVTFAFRFLYCPAKTPSDFTACRFWKASFT